MEMVAVSGWGMLAVVGTNPAVLNLNAGRVTVTGSGCDTTLVTPPPRFDVPARVTAYVPGTVAEPAATVTTA